MISYRPFKMPDLAYLPWQSEAHLATLERSTAYTAFAGTSLIYVFGFYRKENGAWEIYMIPSVAYLTGAKVSSIRLMRAAKRWLKFFVAPGERLETASRVCDDRWMWALGFTPGDMVEVDGETWREWSYGI